MTKIRDNAQDDGREPIGSALARAGSELDQIAKMVVDLEDVVGHAIGRVNSTRELKIAELQLLDQVRQKIEAAATFINGLTEMVSEGWRIDAAHAARSVVMSDMARRLGGSGDAPHQSPPSHGHYELFD